MKLASSSYWYQPLTGLEAQLGVLRSATKSSMREGAVASAVTPIKSSVSRGDAWANFINSWKSAMYCGRGMLNRFIHWTSHLVEAFKPFSEYALTDAPSATDLSSRQFATPNYAFYRSRN